MHHAPMHLSELLSRTALRRPDKIATIGPEGSLTWAELVDRSARLAAGLRELGIEKAGRVGLLAGNSVHFLEGQVATLWADAVLVPLPTDWSTDDLCRIVQDTQATALLFDRHHAPAAEQLTEQCPSLKTCVCISPGAEDTGGKILEALVSDHLPLELSTGYASSRDLAAIYFTGGTTGFPKGVMLSHDNLLHSGLYSTFDLGFQNDDVYLHVAPMYHLADGSQSVANVLFGVTQCFLPDFEPEALLEYVTQYRVSSLLLLPSMLERMVTAIEAGGYDLTSLRRIIYGDADSPLTLRKRAAAVLPNARLYHAYGLTEMGPLVSVLRPEDCESGEGRCESVGKPLVGVDVRIVDPDFRDLPNGQVGRVLATGKNAMLGYWRRPADTRSRLLDGWVVTGDLGHLDDAGYLYIDDREADAIAVEEGYVLSPAVEHVLLQHPAVLQAAVVGLPSEGGTSVHAIVATTRADAPCEGDLIAHCRERLPEWQCPQSISFRRKPLPLSATGKVLKRQLREPGQLLAWQANARPSGGNSDTEKRAWAKDKQTKKL